VYGCFSVPFKHTHTHTAVCGTRNTNTYGSGVYVLLRSTSYKSLAFVQHFDVARFCLSRNVPGVYVFLMLFYIFNFDVYSRIYIFLPRTQEKL